MKTRSSETALAIREIAEIRRRETALAIREIAEIRRRETALAIREIAGGLAWKSPLSSMSLQV